MNIKQNPTPYIIKRGIILYESAVTKKNSQYIKVKYNSTPLIISKNIFIAFSDFITPLYIFNIFRCEYAACQNIMCIPTIYL